MPCQHQARASALNQRSVGLRLRARRKFAAIRRHDALAAASALEEGDIDEFPAAGY
jgi:hypothetical protein